MIFYCFFSFIQQTFLEHSVPGSTVCSRAEILRRFVGKDPFVASDLPSAVDWQGVLLRGTTSPRAL